MKKLTYFLLAGIMGMIFVNHLAAREKKPDTPVAQQKISGFKDVGSTKSIQKHGVLLDSIQLTTARDPQGVVAAGDTIIIFSSDGKGNNYFDTYDFSGNHYREIKDTASSGWGYRDLAFDGQYILASEDSTIKKIDPHTFAIVSAITNNDNKLHRGLAYDPGENVIYSSNWGSGGYLLKINATTGATIKNYGHPADSPYGIAFDPYTQQGKASLWFNYQKSFSTDPFLLRRVDTANALVNYIFDFKGQMPDSCRQGGLEIVNSPAAFPGKVVILATDQKFKKLYLIDISNAGNVLPSNLEVTDEFEGWEAVGATRGMAVEYPYLYAIESGNLSLYDISNNPGQPAYVKTDSTIGHRTTGYGGNKIFKYGDKLFITVTGPYPTGAKDDFTTIESYSISDPANPEYLHKLDVNLPIKHAAFYGNYIFLTHADAANLFSVVKYYADGTMELVHQFHLTTDQGDLVYPIDIQIDDVYHLMFLSSHYTYQGRYIKSTVSVYNILNVNDPELLSGQHFAQAYPTALQILPDRRLAILINNESNSTSSALYCYGYTDLKNLDFRGLKYVSWSHISFDLKMLSYNLLAVSVPDENVQTYYWDDESMIFLHGPDAALDGGADIIPYSVSAAPTAYKSRQAPNPDNQQYYFALLRGYAPEFGWLVTGSEKTGIVKVVKQPQVSQQTLTMSMEPSEAADNGCSVTPSVGKHQYAKGTEINVYAKPNPDKGWYFTGWTGSVTGKDLIQHVVMDADKIAVAHFAKLELTVSGKVGSAWYCPRKIKEDTSLMELPFLVCASDADGWKLSKISFRHSGTGNAYNDIGNVILQKGGTTVYTGGYDMLNQVNVTFNPPISIGPGQCVPFKLIYQFAFEPDGGAPPANPDPYASDEVKTFHVETFGVVAEPWTLNGGDIVGKAHNDTLTFARVRNSQGYLFPKIKDAINAKTTRSGDTCSVCAGYYTESIQLADTTKAFTLLSYEGPEKTVLYPDSDVFHYPFIFMLSGHGSKTIEGFSMYCDSCTGIVLHHARKSLIKNNTMYTNTGISLHDTRTSKVESNFFVTKNEAIRIIKSRDNEVFDNTAGNNRTDKPTFWLWKSDYNNLHNNHVLRLKSKDFGFWIKATESSHNKISKHSLPENYNKTHLIQLINRSVGNEISDNNNFIVKVSKYSDSTHIYQNSLERVRITSESSAGTHIVGNTISGSEENGIDLTYPTFKGMVFIKNNTISGHAGYGIYSDGVKTMIYGNEIYHNGYDAVHGVKKSGVNLENNRGSNLVRNSIYGNMGNGIDLEDSRDILIQHNEISAHNSQATGGDKTAAGIRIYYSTTVYAGKIYIQDNYLAKNCTGITISAGENNEPDVYMKGNTIENSFCLNTGVHVNRGVLHLTGNNIRNNNGNGILLQNGSVPLMIHNNISGNSKYGLNNQTADKITARANYWGNSGGPGTGDIFGNVDYDNWLTTSATLVVFPDCDTVCAAPGTTDSTSLHIQNLNNLTDNLLVSINEEKGWIQAVQDRQITLKDSTGWFFGLKFTIPEGTSSDESEKVYYKVSSTTEQTIDSGWFILTVYHPVPAIIRLNREKATVMFGDSLQFHALVFDQYDHQLAVPLQWQASAGTVSDSGLFVAGSTEGETRVTASDTSGTVTGTARVYVSSRKAVLTRIVVSPDSVVLKPFGRAKFSVKGYNQFGYPMWFTEKWNTSDTAVIVDHNGVCLAKAYPGSYYVIVNDSAQTLADTAFMIVEDVTGIEEKTSRSEEGVFLKQNYPNPVHGKTQISFTLPKAAEVWLSVFDINGREVTRLLKVRKPAGTYNVILDATKLSAGMYFYRLQAGNLIQIKKMIILH